PHAAGFLAHSQAVREGSEHRIRRHAAHLAALLRHSYAARRRTTSERARTAGACEYFHHAGVHADRQRTRPPGLRKGPPPRPLTYHRHDAARPAATHAWRPSSSAPRSP